MTNIHRQTTAKLQSNMAKNKQIQLLLINWRRQFLKQEVLLWLPKFITFICVGLLLALNVSHSDLSPYLLTSYDILGFTLLVLIGAISVNTVRVLRSTAYRSITLNNFISYLNQRFNVLEDSAQLLLRDESELVGLEKLQYDKVCRHFDDILQQQATNGFNQLLPMMAKHRLLSDSVLLLLLSSLLLLSYHFALLDKTLAWFQSQVVVEQVIPHNSQISTDNAEITILSQQVTITVPSYSLTEHQASSISSPLLDIEALVGSYADWTFSFSQPNASYYIVFSNGDRYPLIQRGEGVYTFQKQLTTSMVYHLAVADNNIAVTEQFSTIHRITLTPDQAPKIRFVSPKSTVTEFGINSVPNVIAEVQITDDFALSEVNILASVAKGTGESVKFRDQNFNFDRIEKIQGKRHYFKNWSLLDLAMEPGDELYFTVIATDNRQPEGQQTRSTTKIIRWLEDEQVGINADGVLLDFMQEYFKSQRQIIIETIELLEDKSELDASTFATKSELLGVAQSALKEKYGQYLGDEAQGLEDVGVSFDKHSEGDAHGDDNDDHTDDDHTDDDSHKKTSRPTIQVHDEHGGNHAVITAAAHQHASTEDNHNNDSDLSGRMSLISRYGHTHEDSDVGMMNSEDPKALMKKSLANMWQAELYLMLAEPEQALPYEQQALKLLKQAQKAERIYVKRLGFEPPPVTEQRRYQGEQSDIIANRVQLSQFNTEQLSDQTQLAFRQLLQLLNDFSQTSVQKNSVKSVSATLSAEELALVELVKKGIVQFVKQRPALVDVLATLEKISLERSWLLSQCQQCLPLLLGKLEQLIPQASAVPIRKEQEFYDQQPMVKQYSEFLEENL